MSAPDAVTAVLARVAALSERPAAVTHVRERFATLLATSAQPTVTSSTPGAGSLLAVPMVRPAGHSAPVTPPGDWVSRVPNARGVAFAPAIQAVAARHGLDPAFLAAVFWTESSYTPTAVSPTGAIGLGQLMPETAAWLGVDPWDPMQNMEGAARLYRHYLDTYGGDIELAISAYAAGPGAVKRAGGVPDQFTADYIVKLLGRRDYLNGLRDTPP